MNLSALPEWLSPQQYFKQSGNRPRRRFGQNFLAQPQTARRIVDCARLTGAETVIEVGPGLGALTRHLLLQAGRLVLVELDRDLADYLRERVIGREPPVELITGDILEVSLAALADRSAARLVLLGNLPYNISSPLLFKLLEAAAAIDRAVFMLQLEVAERLTAQPGTKAYGVLSVLLNCYAETRLLFRLGRNQFYPSPKVDSAVVAIDFTARPNPDPARPPFEVLRRLVSVAFSQRRKTLRNCLRPLDADRPGFSGAVLEQLQIDPRRRPETLTPNEFMAITRALGNLRD